MGTKGKGAFITSFSACPAKRKPMKSLTKWIFKEKVNLKLVIILVFSWMILLGYISDNVSHNEWLQPYLSEDETVKLRRELNILSHNFSVAMIYINYFSALLGEADKTVYQLGMANYQMREIIEGQNSQYLDFYYNFQTARRSILDLVWQMQEWEKEPRLTQGMNSPARMKTIKEYFIKVFGFSEDELRGWVDE